MTSADSALAGVLDQLATLGSARYRELIAALRERPDASRLRVLVADEAKRGKSTLVNALLGRAVLPAGVTPLTARSPPPSATAATRTRGHGSPAGTRRSTR